MQMCGCISLANHMTHVLNYICVLNIYICMNQPTREWSCIYIYIYICAIHVLALVVVYLANTYTYNR